MGEQCFRRKHDQPPSAQKSINDWILERSSYKPKDNSLFITKKGTRISNRAVQNMVKRYLIKAGISAQGITVHKLRHTSATLMYKYGKADIRSLQTILGHADILTTAIYTHVSNDQLQSTVNANPLAYMFNKYYNPIKNKNQRLIEKFIFLLYNNCIQNLI